MKEFFSEYKDALITVGWLLAAAGWVISNFQANKREKRKETRSEVDAICKAAAEVVANCRVYYSALPSNDEDDTRAAEIAFEVHRIVKRTERLRGRVSSFEEAVVAVGSFYEAVTAEPFQSKSRETHGPGSPVLLGIEESVHSLIDQLEEGFTLAFTKPWLRFRRAVKNELNNWRFPKKIPE
ncbi:hypothetical protein FFI97_001665 [Variovorax sp. KBS0712]|uniref:hypothetical protein n=1 Tax=Variovorax sp. KBS0712 TaxID=2578111 RepID=UPI00111AFF26|nr:hypothetical protein [Variovorax sp. KBS0712]TSD59065.1 hypothetical protein FFI97_001665 [Variovorax sp. KBS0712]